MGFVDRLTLYSRQGCHLCDDARREIERFLPAERIDEVDVDGSAQLRRRYGSDIPVAVWRGQMLFRHRFDPDCIRMLRDD